MSLRRGLGESKMHRVEDGFQSPQIAVADDLVEMLFAAEDSRSHPEQNHLAALPVSHATERGAEESRTYRAGRIPLLMVMGFIPSRAP